MGFLIKDLEIYDELRDAIPGSAKSKGDAEVRQDCFGFWIKDRESATEEVTFVYRCRQVLAGKATGTGEGIISGDRLYYYLSNQLVSPTATGTAGTDYYFCGWAKENASGTATTVLMNFDGTRYDENI